MPVQTSYAHGTPSFIDLSTTDPEAAQTFYGALFGWTFETNPTDDGGEYHMARIDGKTAAGMMQKPEAMADVPSMWSSYVTVSDLDQTLAAVEAAGGSIFMPSMPVMTAGTMAVVADPVGAVLCLWQAKDNIGSEVVNEHGALTWTECQTPDVSAASAFYGELFGWTTEEMDMGPAGTYTVFLRSGDGVAGAMNPPADGIPPHWAVVFAVDDCDQCTDQALEAGGAILMPPMDIPVGRQAVLADPQGAVFGVIALAEPPA